jgi:hypothetical protein
MKSKWLNKTYTALLEGIDKFGRYTYEDKGPDEVMLVGPVLAELKRLPLKDQADNLNELFLRTDHGHGLAGWLVGSLEDKPDFDKLLALLDDELVESAGYTKED